VAEPGRISRRIALERLAAAAGLMAFAPSRPAARQAGACAALSGARISWLVGWSPGGGYDVYSRLVEPALEAELGAEIAVENVPGAGGVVAARRLMAARPDGRTLAILNGTGLLISPSTASVETPDLLRDFTLLARIVNLQQALTVGTHLGVHRIEDLMTLGRRRPIVLGATGVSTVNALIAALVGELFAIPVRLIVGFPGTVQILASVVRGDLDGAVTNEETQVGVRGIVPLLRVSAEGLHDEPDGVIIPSLAGPGSLLDRRIDLFADPVKAREDVAAVEALTGVGRLVAAPPRMEDPLRRCLEQAVAAALGSSSLERDARRAGRSLVPAPASQVRTRAEQARLAVPRFAGVVQKALAGSGR